MNIHISILIQIRYFEQYPCIFTVGSHDGFSVIKSLITPTTRSSFGSWVDFESVASFYPQKEHALSWKVNIEFLRDFKGIIVFICNVCIVVCKEVFADDAQLSGIPMENDQSVVQKKAKFITSVVV